MAAKRCRSAALDGTHRLPLFPAKYVVVVSPIGLAATAKNVRHVEARPSFHRVCGDCFNVDEQQGAALSEDFARLGPDQVERALDPPNVLRADVNVPLRRPDRGVAEENLDRPNVSARLVEVRCEGVTLIPRAG
jgi:hypothetical protein